MGSLASPSAMAEPPLRALRRDEAPSVSDAEAAHILSTAPLCSLCGDFCSGCAGAVAAAAADLPDGDLGDFEAFEAFEGQPAQPELTQVASGASSGGGGPEAQEQDLRGHQEEAQEQDLRGLQEAPRYLAGSANRGFHLTSMDHFMCLVTVVGSEGEVQAP